MVGKRKPKSEPRSPQELADILKDIREDVTNYLDEEAGEQLSTIAKYLEEVENDGTTDEGEGEEE